MKNTAVQKFKGDRIANFFFRSGLPAEEILKMFKKRTDRHRKIKSLLQKLRAQGITF